MTSGTADTPGIATAAAAPAGATKHVALLIETSRSYGRDLLRGISRYLAEHEHWSLFLELRALDSRVPRWLASWQGDGIIARTASRAPGGLFRGYRGSPNRLIQVCDAGIQIFRRKRRQGHGTFSTFRAEKRIVLR